MQTTETAFPAAIDLAPVFEMALWSMLALVVILVFTVGVFGFTKATDVYRGGRQLVAAGWFALGVAASGAALAAVIWTLVAVSADSPLL